MFNNEAYRKEIITISWKLCLIPEIIICSIRNKNELQILGVMFLFLSRKNPIQSIVRGKLYGKIYENVYFSIFLGIF